MRGPTPFLMFSGERHGKAEEAINFYIAVISNSRIDALEKFGPEQQEPEGMVRSAAFSLNGQDYMAMDNGAPHAFNFTPSVSFFLTIADLGEFESVVARLSEGGQMLMPADDYGFSRRFIWFNDRFGLSWQVNCV